jgi:hypothetical protein
MPEPYWPKRKGRYTLRDARENRSLAHIRCCYCKRESYYRMEDLEKLFGNIEVDDVVRGKVRCSRCGNRHTLEIRTAHPSAAEMQTIVIRRIDRIEYVRRVTWRDERP